MAEVTELVTKFTFQGSTAPLADFNEELGGAISLLGKMVAGLVAVSGVINSLVIATLAGSDSIGQLALTTGVSVEALQELGFAASVSGSNAQALEGTIANLSQTIGQAAQKGNEDFARLGISVRDMNGQVKSADVILKEIGQRFKQLGLSLQEQLGFAQALGIDPSLIQMLNKTSAEMQVLQKRARELGVVSEDQQKKIIEFNDSFTTLRFGMDAVKKQVAIGLSPVIKEMAERFTDFLAANKDLIVDGFIAFSEGLTAILQALDRLKFVIAAIIAGFVAVKIAAIGWGATMAAIFSPVVLITGGIIALLLVVDDLIVAFKGGKSVIRDFFLEFFGFDIKPYLEEFVAAVKMIGEIFVNIFKAAFSLVMGDFDGFIGYIKAAFAGIAEYTTMLFKPLTDMLSTLPDLLNKIPALFDKTADFFGFGDDNSTISPGSIAQGPALTNNTVSQSVTVEIRTDDPATAGQSVVDALQNQLEDANTQLQRGGK